MATVLLNNPVAVARYLCRRRTARNINILALIVFPANGAVMTGATAAGVNVVSQQKNIPHRTIKKTEAQIVRRPKDEIKLLVFLLYSQSNRSSVSDYLNLRARKKLRQSCYHSL